MDVSVSIWCSNLDPWNPYGRRTRTLACDMAEIHLWQRCISASLAENTNTSHPSVPRWGLLQITCCCSQNRGTEHCRFCRDSLPEARRGLISPVCANIAPFGVITPIKVVSNLIFQTTPVVFPISRHDLGEEQEQACRSIAFPRASRSPRHSLQPHSSSLTTAAMLARLARLTRASGTQSPHRRFSLFPQYEGHKISRITVYQVDLPLHESSYNWSGGKSVSTFDATVVRVDTDSGFTGYGEVSHLQLSNS
jgi:hypothetical protein